MITVITLVLVVGTTSAYGGDDLTEIWAARYDGPGEEDAFAHDQPRMLAVSPDGSTIYVAGWSPGVDPGSSGDYATAAYDVVTGEERWVVQHTVPAPCEFFGFPLGGASGLGVSPDGSRVYVSGYDLSQDTGCDFETLAYDADDGEELWRMRYDGPDSGNDYAPTLAVSQDGSRVFVTGRSDGDGTGEDIVTIAYGASDGAELWAARHDGPASGDDHPRGLTVSPDGSRVIVAGGSLVCVGECSRVDYVTLAYDAETGAAQWIAQWAGPGTNQDVVNDVVMSPDGSRVYVTGFSWDGSANVGPTIAYDANDGAGLWTMNAIGAQNNVAVSSDGAQVFTTGFWGGGDDGYLTAAYDASTGEQLWAAQADNDGTAFGLAVSPDGSRVYVGGSGPGESPLDFLTVAYDAVNGTELAGARYTGPDHGSNFVVAPGLLSLSPDGFTLYITGYSWSQATHYDYATVAYDLGLAPSAELRFEPESLDFGEVEGGETSAPRITTLENFGDAGATGLTFTLSGSDDFEADTSACGSSLPPAGSCDVSLTFTPTELGPADAVLQVDADNGATATVALIAEAVPETEAFTPVGIEVDTVPIVSDANGVFEPGELVPVAPIWRNDGLFGQSLAGTASGFTGPTGPIYSLVAAHADYGEVASGEAGDCQVNDMCYQMDIGPSGVERPALHWDSTFDEALSDQTAYSWMLHVGDSFADVPRESTFYRSIEALLHSGVTGGGCTDSEYCPGGVNSRAQMAVFLLKAAEPDPDYEPPACDEGDPMFPDVSASSDFCPWIEELAGRQITSGCGGGNYCPGAAVTRAQMAVFLLRAALGSGYTPPDCKGIFSDVPCPSTFAAWIEDLAARGVTGGCGGDNYCPDAAVTRGQMAAFITETFGLALYRP